MSSLAGKQRKPSPVVLIHTDVSIAILSPKRKFLLRFRIKNMSDFEDSGNTISDVTIYKYYILYEVT